MADKLIFPIGFDLQAAVDAASKKWDSKYAKKLEDLIAKRPVNVQVKIDPSKLGNLDDVKKCIAELKIEPITPETKTAIKELARELTQLAKALELVQKYSTKATKSTPEAVRNSKIEVNHQKAAAQAALAAQRTARAEYNLAAARVKSAQAAGTGASATRNLNREYQNQDGYISRLVKRLAVYAGFQQISSFLTNVREVTAQFELQRVSLGAMIQDQERANSLFGEIKNFALTSPVKILDLTRYTKQLAAYRIETDKLFDTTKRLADVSVGLGVDMDRLILAYGETRASDVMNAKELRQFAMMGIPMLELLSEKLSEIKGKTISTGEAFEMIKKRMVHFDVVAEIFQDLTDKGGTFYNMQEKQGNTLYGMWAKLGDAASVMYDEIGNTGVVNSAMKDTIMLMTKLMKNWKLFGGELMVIGATIAFVVAKSKIHAASTALQATALNKVRSAGIAYNALLKEETILQKTGTAAQLQSVAARKLNAKAALDAAIAERAAATSTGLWTRSLQKLKAAFMSNWITLAIAAIAALAVAIYDTYTKAHKLEKEINEISKSGAIETESKIFGFRKLADSAIEAADGSKQQRDALDELHRVYKDIIPVEELTIQNLKKMKEVGYDPLIESIKEYVAQRTLQKQIDAATNEFTTKIVSAEKEVRELYREGWKLTWSDMVVQAPLKNLSDDEISDVFGMVKSLARDTSKEWQDVWVEALKSVADVSEEQEKAIRKSFGYNYGLKQDQMSSYAKEMREIVESTRNLDRETQNLTRTMEAATGMSGKYNKEWEQVQKTIEGATIKGAEKGSFAFDRATTNLSIKQYVKFLKSVMADAWDDSFAEIEEHVGESGAKLSAILFNKLMNKETWDKLSSSQKKAIKKVKDSYEGLVPTDKTVNNLQMKLLEIADAYGANTDNIKQYLMDTGEDISKYAERIKKDIDGLKKKIKEMEMFDTYGAPYISYTEEQKAEQKEQLQVLEALFKFLEMFTKSSGSGKTQDPRLNNLKEEISLTKKLYDEYKKLERQIGATKAAEKIQEIYANTIKTLQERAGKYGFTFELPFTDENLKANMQQFINKMKELQNLTDKKGQPLFPNIGKDIDEAVAQLEDVGFNSLQKTIEQKLKELSDKISHTKTAREFYDKILSQTGNVEMAANLTMSIYGNPGEDLKEQIAMQINNLMQSGEGGIEIGLDVVGEGYEVNYKNLRKLTEEAYKAKKIGDDAYKQLISIADNGEKDVSKLVEGWMKATEKAKTYTDKLLDASRTTRAEIEKIEAQRKAGNITDDYADRQVQEYKDKLAKQQTELAYEAFKDSPMYVQMFDDLDNASTRMLENMKTRMEGLKSEWKNLTPAQIKELQSRMNEIDAQLAKRNPFKTLSDAIKKYRDYMKNGEADGKTKSAKEAENLLMTTSKTADEAQKKYDELIKKYGEGSEKSVQEVIDAKNELDKAMANEEAAQKAVENWKKVKDAIGLSANELFAMLNWAGDIARAVADVSEALGADEEDVQYWNTVADSLSDIAGGIQDIVSAAMSGNVVGIVSSTLTAIPKMFVGFSNLFAAGKIRKANKEIKRQQELLEQLEYTYSRLEKVADKAFGRNYINNYNQQLENLQAQQTAYLKQAEAERSKGKKADKDKIKEYENAARETADAIKELQDDLSAHFTGKSRTDAARQMAQSWVEARSSLSDTFAAIKSDYAEMIKNMIVEGAAARVIENALTPMWNQMDKMLADNNIEGAIDSLVNGMDDALNAANNGMEVLWQALEARGYDMKQLIGDTDSSYTGIKREVAGATSEEMNANTAALNTQNYYLSQVPGMAVNLAAIRQMMENGNTSSLPSASAAGWTDWQQQAMDSYLAIQRNTADTVVECRRAAVAAESAVAELRRVIKPRSTPSTHSLHVTID